MLDSASFWTDIKNLEEQLEKSPDSYCFARLSDVYLKVGMVDDALHFARQGVQKHPGYLAGQRALALACHAKGLNDEARASLQLVATALPEDVSVQKLLGRLYAEGGDQAAALRAFRTALEFAPDDKECRIELDSLERSNGTVQPYDEYEDDDEDVIEDLEIVDDYDDLDDFEDFDETPPLFKHPSQGVSSAADSLVAQHHDPLSTGTLAELYVRQGFIDKALEIYRAILLENPSDKVTEARVIELEAMESRSSALDVSCEDVLSSEAGDETAFFMPSEESTPLFATSAEQVESMRFAEVKHLHGRETVAEHAYSAASLQPQGAADNAVATLDGWLENIRRIRSCR